MALLLEWGCTEGAGTTTTDTSGNGRTGVVAGWADGHTSEFGAKGTSSQTAVGYTGTLLASPSTFSTVCWYNPSVTSGNPDAITIADASGATYLGVYWSDSTHISLYVGDSAGYTESGAVSLSTTAWSHIAVTVSPTQAVLYVNGAQAATISHSGTFNTFTTLEVGGHSSKNQGTYNDVRFTDTTLTQAEVTAFRDTPVGSTAPSVTTRALKAVYTGEAFSQTLDATNEPSSWAITAGALPAGLSLNTVSGVIAGTPTGTAGTTYSVSVTATNDDGTSTAVTLTGTVRAKPAPIVEWAADEGTGTVTQDLTGNGFDGSTQIDGWVTGHGSHPYAASGNATGPGVMLEDVSILNGSPTITIMCWVKAIVLTGSGDLLEVKSAHTPTSGLGVYRPSATSLAVWAMRSGGSEVGSDVLWTGALTGQWVHIAVTLDGSSMKLYVDGVLAGTVTVSTGTDLGDIRLFYAGGTETKPNQGAVNDVRLFSTALADDEIAYWKDTPAHVQSSGVQVGDTPVTSITFGSTPITQVWMGATKVYG